MKAHQQAIKQDKRIFEYLIGHYERLSQHDQRAHLESIITRLCDSKVLNYVLAKDIVNALIDEELYTMPMLLAHFDMLDLEDRT